MKTITNGTINEFKSAIKEMGRQLNSKITFDENKTIDGESVLSMDGNHIFSVRPILNADLLRSVVKGLEFESDIEFDIDERIKYEFGLLKDESLDTYYWVNYGYYYIQEREYNEDTKRWSYKCYDKLRLSMVEYNGLENAVFPMTVRSYLTEILEDLDIDFANSSDTFTNYDKVLQNDPYVSSEDGSSLGYKYRDILDELSAVVGGCITMNNSDEAMIKYPTSTNDEIDEEYLKDINVKFGKSFGPLNTVILKRSGESDGVYRTYPSDLPVEDRIAIEIDDNQVMNGNDRGDYCQAILDRLKGLQFYINDFNSTGIMYYDLLDMYSIKITPEDEEGNQETPYTYPCLILNDEPTIEEGLEERIFTDMPEVVIGDYENMSKDDRMIKQVYIIVKKNEGVIESLVGDDGDFTKLEQTVEGLETTVTRNTNDITTIKQSIDGLEIDITKKGENLIRNTMFWNYDGWLGNTFEPLLEAPNPPTITGNNDIIYWYCTETKGIYENGVIYHYSYINETWEETTMLRKDFYNGAINEVGVAIEEDRDNFLSGNKLTMTYDGTSATEYTGVWSELFEISPTQEELSFQFKMNNTVTSGEVVIALMFFNNEYVNRINMYDYQVGSYMFRVNSTTQDNSTKLYSVKIPLNKYVDVYASSSTPATTTVYWLDTSDSDNFVLKKYNEEEEQWEINNVPSVLRDQNGGKYGWSIYGDTNFYYAWTGDTTIRYGQVMIVPDSSLTLPNMVIQIGDMKAEYGVATDWAPRQDENYSMNHRMDATGYTIRKGDNRLFLDEDEVTGYYKDNKMFFINKNEVYSHLMTCIIEDIDGLVTKKANVSNHTIYIRYIK